ncbi:MAG: ABC transporter ATP-binding protein [Rubrivivax sp.]
MTDDRVIELRRVSKSYSLENRPWHRLWNQLTGRPDRGRQHHALRDVDLGIRRGEVVGIIGRNGAGKSTLLQLVCGVLQPSAGERRVSGRIAALLELGAGFNPELTGRENVRLNGPLLGLSAAELERSMDGIVEFAGIGDFIDQPVRSYSSGMFVRLAFSMATSVQPDILVIDEALSVGDGAFAHKSFERIMALKERGATILFCSHSMFQVEQLCSRALWVHDGVVRFDGPAHLAVLEYDAWQARQAGDGGAPKPSVMQTEAAQIEHFQAIGDGTLRSGEDSLRVQARVRTDPALAAPTLGVVIHGADGRAVTSAGSWLDGVALERDAQGRAELTLEFPRLALLRGRYTVSLYVLCDRSVNLWAAAEHAFAFEVAHDGPQQGVVALPHVWHSAGAA